MRNMVRLSRFGVLCALLWSCAVLTGGLRAQAAPGATPPEAPAAAKPAAEAPASKSAGPEALGQGELLKAYLQLREQLQVAQQAIVDSRREGAAAARAQAAALTEKLDGIRAELSTERERRQADAQRQAAEREQEQAAAQRANRTLLWLAAAIGGVGLLAMLLTTLFQWRAIVRIAEVGNLRPSLATSSRFGLLAENSSAPGEAVTLSNQRLLAVIDRLEGRIAELEHTAQHPLPAATAVPVREAEVAHPPPTADPSTRINALLGKGWSLYNRNRLNEALAAYDEILELDPNHPDALVRKGLAFEKQKKDLDALACYDLALKADPKMTIAYLSKGRVCNRLERYDEALECYEQALPSRAGAK